MQQLIFKYLLSGNVFDDDHNVTECVRYIVDRCLVQVQQQRLLIVDQLCPEPMGLVRCSEPIQQGEPGIRQNSQGQANNLARRYASQAFHRPVPN